MYARVLTFKGAKDIDGGVSFLREKVLPVLTQQHGFRSVSASADRAGGVLGVVSLWDTPEDREASFSVLKDAREEARGIVGVAPEVGNYEETVVEFGDPPAAPGCAVMVTRIHMDPANLDVNVPAFKSEVLPRMRRQPGFRGVRHMIDRASGDGVVATVWSDDDAMRRWAEEARAARQQAMDRGVTFSEPSFREIVLMEVT